jgi:hypothetical protein
LQWRPCVERATRHLLRHDDWRKQAISLIDPVTGVLSVNGILQQ